MLRAKMVKMLNMSNTLLNKKTKICGYEMGLLFLDIDTRAWTGVAFVTELKARLLSKTIINDCCCRSLQAMVVSQFRILARPPVASKFS